MKTIIVAFLFLSGCMRCDPFQLACPTGKVCADGYCQDACKQQQRDVEHRVFHLSDCYPCLTDTAPGAFDVGNHYRCLDAMCSECEAPPVPGMFGKHAHDGGARP